MPNYPRHPSQRRRRNAAAKPLTTAPRGGAGVKPPSTPRGLHPEAARWFKSLAESGQAQFYEPSDWSQAVVGARLLSHWYETQRAASMTAWQRVCDRLLTTESARRQASIEVAPLQVKTPGTSASDGYRAALGLVRTDDTPPDKIS